MAWRDATEEEQQLVAPGGFRDATPAEVALITGQVRPGDVEARKKQLLAEPTARAGDVRPPVTIGGEAVAGMGQILDSVTTSAKGNGGPLIPNLKDIPAELANTSVGKLGLGALRVAGSPLAPLENLSAATGEKTQDALLNAGVNPTIAAAAATAADLGTNIASTLGLGLVGRALKAPIKALLPSKRVQAAEAGLAGEKQIAGIEARSAESIREAEQKALAAKQAARTKAATEAEQAEQLRDVGIAESKSMLQAAEKEAAAIRRQTEHELRAARSSADAANESAMSFAEAAKRQLPDKQTLHSLVGDTTSEGTGRLVGEAYHAKRSAAKKQGDALYEEALGPRPDKGRSIADIADEVDDQVAALEAQLRNATTPEAKNLAEAAKREYISSLNQEPKGLWDHYENYIKLKEGARAAARARNDNTRRLLLEEADTVAGKMKALDPDVMDKLLPAQSFYARAYAPFFSKHSTTRAVVEKDPSVIARNLILPRSKGGKELEVIGKAAELFGDDPSLLQKVSKAHLNELIESAGRRGSGDFRDNFVREWDRFVDPANNNRVLRTAYGKEYDSVNSVVNQFKHAKPRDIYAAARAMVEATNKRLAGTEGRLAAQASEKLDPLEALMKDAPRGIDAVVAGTERELKDIARAKKAELSGASRELQESIRLANKTRKLDLESATQRIEDEIRKFMGENVQYVGGGKFKSRSDIDAAGKFIGPLYLVQGSLQTATRGASAGLAKILEGGLIIMAREGLSKLMATHRGRSVLKATIRATPGSTEAAANARMLQSILKQAEGEESTNE